VMMRARPAELHPGALRIITARMDYLPDARGDDWQQQEEARLTRPGEAVISMYARGRDYHKVLRNRLQKLADRLADEIGPLGHRCFTDSAPVMEVELATRSGLGWRGKHTLTLARDAGSMFFLGEIFVDIALPLTAAAEPHCGRCTACMDVCPTQAIVAPERLDARRCISYLTIESDDPIPLEFRRAIGNRIYGCDDCQVVCPAKTCPSRRCWRSGRGTKRSSCAAPKARRSAASAMGAGSATSPWRWATRCMPASRANPSKPRCARASRTQALCSRSTYSGPCRPCQWLAR
jgi:epoxyqueuosine reductase